MEMQASVEAWLKVPLIMFMEILPQLYTNMLQVGKTLSKKRSLSRRIKRKS
jgi:hypothetical protein